MNLNLALVLAARLWLMTARAHRSLAWLIRLAYGRLWLALCVCVSSRSAYFGSMQVLATGILRARARVTLRSVAVGQRGF